MTKLNLFLELMDTIHTLLEIGVTDYHAYDARLQFNSIFDNFEENDGVALPDSHKVFEDIFFTVEHMPEEFQQYFYTMDNFHSKNKIHLKTLPPQACIETTQQAELVTGLFSILNELLEVGISACNNHQALMKINDLFDYFLEVEEIPQDDFTTALDEDENTRDKERFNTFSDYISIKQEQVQDLPQHISEYTSEYLQLMAGLFAILMDLLEPDKTPFSARETFIKIDDLFQTYDQQSDKNQEIANDENEDGLSHYFPDMKENLDKPCVLL